MNQKEFLVETGLVIKTCISCGITYAIPKDYEKYLRESHDTFFCPNGHSMYFARKTDKEILEEKLTRIEQHYDACKISGKKLDYQARYWKGQATKLRKES